MIKLEYDQIGIWSNWNMIKLEYDQIGIWSNWNMIKLDQGKSEETWLKIPNNY